MSEKYEPKQGDIVWMDFDSGVGHEQTGRRPAVIISNETAFRLLNTRAMVCPITGTNKGIPIQPVLDSRSKTTGVILCDQARIMDIVARRADFIEKLPKDILREVIDIVYSIFEYEEESEKTFFRNEAVKVD